MLLKSSDDIRHHAVLHSLFISPDICQSFWRFLAPERQTPSPASAFTGLVLTVGKHLSLSAVGRKEKCERLPPCMLPLRQVCWVLHYLPLAPSCSFQITNPRGRYLLEPLLTFLAGFPLNVFWTVISIFLLYSYFLAYQKFYLFISTINYGYLSVCVYVHICIHIHKYTNAYMRLINVD